MTLPRRHRVFTAAAALAIAAAIVGGLFVLGSPAEQRRYRLDQRRIRDLNAIAAEVDRFWRANERLPATLADLPGNSRLLDRNDPSTDLPYEYRPIADRKFELCGEFERESKDAEAYSYGRWNWAHGRGRHCFEMSVADLK